MQPYLHVTKIINEEHDFCSIVFNHSLDNDKMSFSINLPDSGYSPTTPESALALFFAEARGTSQFSRNIIDGKGVIVSGNAFDTKTVDSKLALQIYYRPSVFFNATFGHGINSCVCTSPTHDERFIELGVYKESKDFREGFYYCFDYPDFEDFQLDKSTQKGIDFTNGWELAVSSNEVIA